MNNVITLLASWKDKFPDGSQFHWIVPVVEAITTVLWPLLIVVSAAGLIYAVIIGVGMAKADSTEKREEAKKRLYNLLIGMAITIGLILFFLLFINTILPAFFNNGDISLDPTTVFKLLK